MKKTKTGRELLDAGNSLIEEIMKTIQLFENVRDYERGLSEQESDYLNVLYFALDLFAKTKFIQSDKNNYIAEVKDDFGEVMKNVYKYPLSTADITDKILEKLKNLRV